MKQTAFSFFIFFFALLRMEALFAADKSFSLHLKSALALRENSLLPAPNNWWIEIPWTEVGSKYHFSKNGFIEAEFDFSYQEGKWSYFIDNFFVQQKFVFFTPFSLRAGYFFYPVSWTEKNIKLLSKKTLLEQNLFSLDFFPSNLGAGGALARGDFWPSFYWQASAQLSRIERETDVRRKTKLALTASLVYKESNRQLFISYFQKDSVLSGLTRSLGLGSHLSYKRADWAFGFQGELWGIQKQATRPVLASPFSKISFQKELWAVREKSLVYYALGSVRWSRLEFSAFFGGAHHYLPRSKSHILEYVLKADFYLTENLSLTIERLKEWDSLIKKKGWAFSLKTNFEI